MGESSHYQYQNCRGTNWNTKSVLTRVFASHVTEIASSLPGRNDEGSVVESVSYADLFKRLGLQSSIPQTR